MMFRLMLLFLIGRALDVAITMLGLQHFGHLIRESNPIVVRYGWVAGGVVQAMVVTSTLLLGGLTQLVPPIRRDGRWFMAAAALISWVPVIWNPLLVLKQLGLI